jgi:hypothetical protein
MSSDELRADVTPESFSIVDTMNRRRITAIVSSLACIVLLGLPRIAMAQSEGGSGETSETRRETGEGGFEAHVSRAREFYANEEYDKALEQFEQAYEIKQSANLLFNMGLVNERMGNLKQALTYYEKFAVSSGIELEMRKKAKERIKVVESLVEESSGDSEESTDEETTPPDRESPEGLAESDQQTDETEANDERAQTEESTASGASTSTPSTGLSTQKKIAFVTLGVGGASLVTGGVFAILGEKARGDFETRTSPAGRRRASRAAFRNILVADIALGTGLALATTGAILWATDDGTESAPSRARLVPRLGPRRTGLELSIDF